MPKIYELRAAKDYPAEGIRKGDTYYKWSLRPDRYSRGVVYRSSVYPPPSRTTSSPFLRRWYEMHEALRLDDPVDVDVGDVEGAAVLLHDMVEELREMEVEETDKLENMPDGLRDGPTGTLLEERSAACGTVADAAEIAAEEIETIAEELADEDIEPTDAWVRVLDSYDDVRKEFDQ